MTSTKRRSETRSAILVLIILLAGAVLLPFGYGLDLGPGPNRIRALIWEYIDAPWFSGVRIVRIGEMLEALLYTLPRYFFLFQIFNLYRTSLSQKRIWPVGILGASFPGLVSLVLIVGWLQGWTQPPPPQSDHYFPIYIPIPTILIMSIILLRLLPVRRKD
ncbi:MAG TPA: hypothetical protein G4O08_13665 [Anaerolineae bacterium]|nr:hypothetical protein [Anaerolineae bacterium]